MIGLRSARADLQDAVGRVAGIATTRSQVLALTAARGRPV